MDPQQRMQLLSETLRECTGDKSFAGAEFFRRWFKELGRAYFFVFTKSVQVTNLQFTELLGLLRAHIKPSVGDALLITTATEFQEQVKSLVESFVGKPETSASELVAMLYGDALIRTIVMDPFMGSCAVFLPPGLDVHLNVVCGLSGYIHSAGRNVLVRRVRKAEHSELQVAISAYLNRYPQNDAGRAFFAVYAHEDFSPYDRSKQAELRHGLDDIKIFVEKFFFGSVPLVECIGDLQQKVGDRLAVCPPGHYKHERSKATGDPTIDSSHTLWLIVDRELGETPQGKGDRFYVCYDQLIRNASPFLIFDENKPGWIDHTTMPHAMCAALVNTTKPWPLSQVHAADPFAGSGTLGLELLKEPTVVRIDLGDANGAADVVARDNLWFFSRTPGELSGVHAAIEAIEDAALVEQGMDHADILAALATKAAAGTDFASRVSDYLRLRALRRRGRAVQRNASDWARAVTQERKNLLQQIEELRATRQLEDDSNTGLLLHNGRLIEFEGSYSRQVSVSYKHLRHIYEELPRFVTVKYRDARVPVEGGEHDAIHIVITDPPYGFNTQEEPELLARVYDGAIRNALRLLLPGGHLVVCLLEESHVGNVPAHFTHPGFVARQIIALAQEMGRELYQPVARSSGPAWLAAPPYYWESERALRRAILHFRVR